MGIRMIPPGFPERRRQDPKRRAEADVFDALRNLGLDGHGIYEFRYRRGGRQVDFALWLNDMGRFAGSAKGGNFLMDRNGQWYRRGLDGVLEPISSPLKELVDGCIEMRNGIIEATSYKNFIAGLLFLPDMQPDEAIERVAREHEHLYVIFGLGSLEEDLKRIVEMEGFVSPPEPRHSVNESSKVNELQIRGSSALREDGREMPDGASGQANSLGDGAPAHPERGQSPHQPRGHPGHTTWPAGAGHRGPDLHVRPLERPPSREGAGTKAVRRLHPWQGSRARRC